MKIEREEISKQLREMGMWSTCVGDFTEYILSLLAKQQAEHDGVMEKVKESLQQCSCDRTSHREYSGELSCRISEALELLKNVGE